MVKCRKLGWLEALTLGTGVVVGLGSGGCDSAIVRPLAYAGAQQVVTSSVRKSIEGPRGTTVNVNNSMPVRNTSPVMGAKKFYVWVYKDKNGDGSCDAKTEILGEVDGPVNLSEVGLATYLSNSSYINYSAWNLSGDLIGEGIGNSRKLFCTMTSMFSGDFMDNLNGSPDGDYKIKAFSDGETFSKNVTIFRSDSKDISSR